MTYSESKQINEIINKSAKILIIQADNPDADSLGSALALEAIFNDLGKSVSLYCSVEMPQYLRYLKGWDRISNVIPNDFDVSVIVDASTMTLLEKLSNSGSLGAVKTRPVIVLDHHATVENKVDFATVCINDGGRSSAGELIYAISEDNAWPLSQDSIEAIAVCILGDTQGLTNNLASARTYRIFAELLDKGVSRAELEELRRDYNRMPETIYQFKADLIKRTEFFCKNRLAIIKINQAEINQYSPLYNPAPLIQGDMLQVENVEIAVVLKSYSDGRITGAIRSNNKSPIAGKLAEIMGGGGHDFASGFKIVGGASYDEVKSKIVEETEKLLS